ncbi:MAG TPA: penicillin-binding protein [Bacteroidales bacterium]|nr:penicillin-binding protein [Bacteroidales bacterium]
MKSLKSLILPLFLLVLILFSSPLKSQERQSELKKGVPVPELLTAGDKHRYIVTIDANMFAYFSLVQKGVDVLITTYDPDGNKIQSFDSPNGRSGPEPVILFSEKKGNYVLELTALEEKGYKGRYELVWLKLEPRGTTPEKQIDQLFTTWNTIESPGAAVAVEKDGKIIYKKGFGSAELEYNIPITPQTVFHIASISKQFTCFSILLLEKQGKLSIDDDIRKYIPEVPDFGKVITLNHLMHHTSGLRDQWELLAMAGWRLDDIITKDQILRIVSRQKELNFSPGEEYMYCNTGFTLLAEVVARVSGQPFPEFTRINIFEPLKMTNTLFYDDCEKIVRNRAYSFYADSTGYKKSILSYSNAGATSLFTTAEDLCKWSVNFENPVVGGKDIIDRMSLRGVLNKGDTITYALGQDIGSYKGLKIISHGGADAGYRSFLVRFPDQKFSVNVLSNLASFDPGGMSFKIADIYLKDKEVVAGLKKEETGIKAPAVVNDIKVDHDILVSYCGQYEWQPGIFVTVSLENDILFVSAPELPKTPMVPVSATEFDVKPVSARVTFVLDSGKVSKMQVKMNGGEVIAMKTPDFDPAKINVSEYTGNFYSEELSTAYTMVADSGKLIARHFRTGDVMLTGTKPDNFTGNQWYFRNVAFTRDSNGKIIGCRVSGGRVKNLKFTKISE